MWVGLLALLVQTPVLSLPTRVPVELHFRETRLDIRLAGEIQDPIRVWAPRAREVWVNGEKMTCRQYGNYRLVTFPILHNQEACELY